jgi:S-formylglutathione hydrolase
MSHTAIEIKSTTKVFNGFLIRFSHQSIETKTTMTNAVYLPIDNIDLKTESSLAIPSIFYLSGLTCTDENVCQKGGQFKYLSELRLAFVAPDTSPRGANIPGEDDSWDFGTGAGFYLDATNSPWDKNYRMYSYITKELPEVLSVNFPCLNLNRWV